MEFNVFQNIFMKKIKLENSNWKFSGNVPQNLKVIKKSSIL